MKKKGFTLVELLAVIAILAILVIIALPNIMDLFNQAKKNSFENEAKEIFRTAQSQWINDSINGASDVFYARGTGCDDYELKLSGRTDIQYAVSILSTGEVSEIVVTDGTYFVTAADELDVTRISGNVLPVEEWDNSTIITGISCHDDTWSVSTAAK